MIFAALIEFFVIFFYFLGLLCKNIAYKNTKTGNFIFKMYDKRVETDFLDQKNYFKSFNGGIGRDSSVKKCFIEKNYA